MDMEEMMKAAQEAAANIQKQMGEAQAKLDSVEVELALNAKESRVDITAFKATLGSL